MNRCRAVRPRARRWARDEAGLEYREEEYRDGRVAIVGVVTLPAGTYEVDAGWWFITRIHHLHDVTARAAGHDEQRHAGGGVYQQRGRADRLIIPAIKGIFTLTGTANIEMQYFFQTIGSPKLGYATSSGETDLWASVYLKRKA